MISYFCQLSVWKPLCVALANIVFLFLLKILYKTPLIQNFSEIFIYSKDKKVPYPKKETFDLSIADELTKLNDLRVNGVITDENFNQMKSKIIDNKK